MDVKDLRTEPTLSERNNDGSKYTQGGVATLQYNRNKTYQDIGSTPLAKAEGVPVRPCAVIGPDRVVPPAALNDAFLKKGSVEPWPSPDNGYRRPPDYPHRLQQNPARNISPRQTFQENMQRINVPPTYNAVTVRHSDSASFNHIQDRSGAISKNTKPNMAPDAKYCDVPYAINALPNEPKSVRDSEMYVSSVNPQMTRSAPHGWPPGSVNVNAPRTYSATDPYQYPQYSNCAGLRPPLIPMTRPHRTIQEDTAYVYPDHYYRDAIGRLKPYSSMKERCPQPRYEYVGNYPGQFQTTPPIPHKYDIPKPGQTNPYPGFPHFKYLDNRVPVTDPTMESYQRSTSLQPHYNLPFRTQVIHPPYAQMPGNAPQKVQHYVPDGSVKSIPSNKLHYDNSNKMFIDYENARTKPYSMADNYYVNEMNRYHPLKNQMIMPNYSPLGMHTMPSQQYYLKDNPQMKPFEYMPTFRNFDPHLTGNPVLRHAPQFSPNTLAISPTDSSTSNDTLQTHGTAQEDCGYVSQTSTTSLRSIDSGIYRLPHEYYKRHDFRYGPIVGSSHTLPKTDLNSKDNKQKQIDVRQFLQMWNEGEEENNSENINSKDIIAQTGSNDTGNFLKHDKTEDQLYVLGLVNVPSEELSKYEHIEKISKLPENIKGYNNLELFSRFEEAMESCNTTSAYKAIPKEYQISSKDNSTKLIGEALPRPVSPLDVEAKISQSVIHKEVGCNFEIKPCSPKMLNVEVAAPAQNILGERVIEKVSNPLSKIVNSPLPMKSDENSNCHTVIRQDNVFAMTDNPSCKMVRSPFSSNNMDSVKTNYSLQDLEINSGVCLASLPQLDNEIELNFPEVNQQFINANKIDGVSTPNNSYQGNLQENACLPGKNKDKTDGENSKIILTESDKTFSKLSKYRKSKTNATDYSEKKTKAVRTDSVIIKNPENIENKMLENSLNIPMNLSSQSVQWCNSPHELKENKNCDMALDFSLNKSGNDLPIIDTEKDVLIEPFQINHSHSSHENALLPNIHDLNHESGFESVKTDPNNISCIQIYQDLSREKILPISPTSHDEGSSSNNDNLNTNESISECTQTISKIQNNQEACIDSNETFKSVVVKKDTDISITDSLVFEDTEHSNKNDSGHVHTNDDENYSPKIISSTDIISEESVKNYNTDENIMISNGKIDNCKNNLQLKNDPGISHLEMSHTERNKVIDNMKQFFSPDEYCEINKNKFITSQNENDFEHDEISASLEKLFRDSNEETSPLKNNICSSSVPVAQCFKKSYCHHSKKLYSPWIQKLLTHSEGSCSNNELPQKNIFKSIFDPEEQFDKPFKFNDNLEHGIERQGALKQYTNSVHTKSITTIIQSTSNKFATTNATIDLALNFIPKSEATTLNKTPDTDSTKIVGVLSCRKENEPQVTTLFQDQDIEDMTKPSYSVKKPSDSDSTKKIEDTLFHKVENELQVTTLIQKQDIEKVNKNSYRVANWKKRDSEGDIDSSIRKTKKRKRHISKFPKNLSNCNNTHMRSCVKSKIDTNECKSNIAEKYSDMFVRKNVYDPENIIETNVSDVASKKQSGFVSDDKKENQTTKHNRSKDISIENTVMDHYTNISIASEIINSDSNLKLGTIMQHDLKEPSFKYLSNKASNSSLITNHKNGVKPNEENVTENSFESCNKDSVEIPVTYGICTDDSAFPNKHSIICTESLSKSVSLIITEDQKQKTVQENMVTIVTINDSADIGEELQTTGNNNVVQNDQKVSAILSTEYMDQGNEKESKSLLSCQDYVTKHCTKDAYKTSISSNDLINDCERLCINKCISYHQSEELLKKRNNVEDKNKELNKSTCTNIICTNYTDQNQINQNSCSSERHISNNSVECQINESQCNESFIENVNNTLNIHQMLKSSEQGSPDVDAGDKNVNQDFGDKNIHQDSKKSADYDSHKDTGDLHQKVSLKNTFNSNGFLCKTLDNASEDQHNCSSEILSIRDLDNSIGYKTQQNHNEELITETVSEDLTEVKSNYFAVKPYTTNTQVGSAVQKIQHHLKKIYKSTNNYTKHEPGKKKEQECIVPNSEILREQTSKICTPNENVEFDYDANERFMNDSNFECHSINGNNDIKPETKNDIKVEIGIENKNISNNTDLQTISSEAYEESDRRKKDSKSYSLIPEEKNDKTFINIPDASDECIKDYNEQTTLLNTDAITETDDVCCKSDKDSYVPVVENDLIEFEFENHSPATSVEESLVKRRLTLKRSFSDSALNKFKSTDTPNKQLIDNTPMWPPKRQKMYEFDDSMQHNIDENFCNFIQNRRNSISSYYNAENVSFCILIDNDCILTEENEEDKICFAEVSEECIDEVNTAVVEDNESEVICSPGENELDFSESIICNYNGEKTIEETWLDNVACVETVVSDDIVQDSENDASGSSKDIEVSSYESGIFNSDISEIAHEVTFANEEAVQNQVSELDKTYRSPRSEDKIMLYDEEPLYPDHYNTLYSGQCLENILSKSYYRRCSPSPTSDYIEPTLLPDDSADPILPEDKENIFVENVTLHNSNRNSANKAGVENNGNEDTDQNNTSCSIKYDNTMPESSLDNVFNYKKQDDDASYTSISSSSPEVSSTTFEEKSSSILLKITNYNGSRVSEINEVSHNRPRCKFTESKEYSSSHGSFPKRPLITKAAQKYIPPLKECIRDIKVKLPLPQQRLLKLKQLKLSRTKPKVVQKQILSIPKLLKPKPNFEDVLKNIDEIQIKMHKQNSKKNKNIVPKVVIKKNVNGSHYTSSSSKEKFNPDLTGRKWQPWVFLERNRFIDNMAMRNKSKAIYSHRKKTFVLAEKFKKYKSASNCSAKFIISQPKTSDLSKGQLKYTIRLKHS